MKFGKLFLCVIASAALLAGCKEKEEDLITPKISASETSLEFDMAGGAEAAQTVTVTSTRDWHVEFEPKETDWLVVTPSEGNASENPQEVTIYPESDNDGTDRTVVVVFKTSTVAAEITVVQKGQVGEPDVYRNDFDKELATKTFGTDGKYWPYLDQFEGWQNQTGSGVANVAYEYAGASARNNLNSNGGDYAGSGKNNVLFGTSSYLQINNITLDENVRNYTLSFGAIRNEYEAEDNTFNPDEFHVYISNDSEKWVELEYAFPDGFKDDTWDQASSTFTLPEGTTVLYIHFASDLSSSHRIDDVALTISDKEGTLIDFTTGGAIGGDDEPTPVPEDAVYFNDFDKAAATEGSSGWPYADRFDGARNDQGTGASTATFESYNTSVRTSGASDSHSDYDGSGTNNIFFGKDNAWFRVNNITLDGTTVNYTLSFGSEKFGYDIDNTFNPDEFKVYLSNDGEKWVEIEYAFPEGFKEGTWDLASSTFTVPSGTESLYIHFTASVASVYRIDDLSLVPSATAGTEIDFSTGGPIEGGEAPDPGEITDATVEEFLAASEGNALYRLTGTITNITNTEYGNFTLVDETGSVYVFGLNASATAGDKTFSQLNLSEGDVVTLVGKRGSYNDNPQVNDAYYESHEAGEDPEPSEPVTIAEIYDMAEGTALVTEGQVMATCTRGFIISDETASILVYDSDAVDLVKIGETISVSGAAGEYNNMPQITDVTVEHISDGVPAYPEPKEVNNNESGLVSAGNVTYVTYTGVVTKSGNYYNFDIEGAQRGGSVYYPDASSGLDSHLGETVVMNGYFMGYSSSYFYILPTSVTPVAVENQFTVSPLKLSVPAEGGNYTFTVTASDDLTWQATTVNDYVQIKSSTSVTGNGIVEVSVLPNDGAARTATVTIASVDGNDGVNPVAVTLSQAGIDPVAGMTIAQVWDAADGDAVTTGEVQVVAKTTSGFIISDATGSIYVYGYDAAEQVTVGDKINLSGERDEYNGLNQIRASEVLQAGSGAVSYPVPAEYTADNASSLSGTTDVEYITYEGELSVSGNYVNVTLLGADSSTPTMSLYYLPDSFNADGMNGKIVTVTGYYIYTSGGRYLNTVVTALEESSTPYLNLSEASKNVGAAAGSFTFTVSSNVEWTVSSSDETNFSVSPASGSNDGTVTVTYTENTNTESRQVTVTVAYGSENKTLIINQSGASTGAEVTDVLTADLFPATGTTYTDFSGITATSQAEYAGNTATTNDAIQLRSKNSNSGIVTTKSGGKVKRVIVTWNSTTAASRQLDIYVSNEAYTSATELYATGSQKGTKIGSLSNGETTFEITGDYEFIGLRSNDGAMYLDKVEVVWEAE